MSKLIKEFVGLTIQMRQGRYDYFVKTDFRKQSRKVLKQIGKDLGLKTMEIRYNPGGDMVAGEASFSGVWDEGEGIYIQIAPDSVTDPILYRSATHLKDFRGGVNRFAKIEDLLEYEEFIETLKRVRGSL